MDCENLHNIRNMNKITNRIKSVVQWYCANWKHPLWIFILLALLAFPCLLLMSGNWHDAFFTDLFSIMMLLQVIHIVLAGITGIIVLCRQRICCALAIFMECTVFFFVMISMVMAAAFTMAFVDNDHFADNLELPKDMQLSEPLDGGYEPFSQRMLSDAFQKEVVGAIGNGSTLKPEEECHLPALERLMATPEGKRKVLDYLSASPNWTLRYNVADRLYATRNSHDSKGMVVCSENHSLFPSTNLTTGLKEGIRAQYSFRIYFDGTPNRLFAKGKKPFDCIVKPSNDGVIFVETWLMAGSARVYIYDESVVLGRQMTVKMLELVNREFEALETENDMSAYDEKRPLTVKLYNGMQGGMYLLDIWCNPGETGTLSVRAQEITKGTRLSEDRLKEHQVKVYGCSQTDVSFHSQIDFTIYEGNWEQYYGARLELWFTPDSGAPARQIWAENYRIQGWMR